MRIQVLIEHIRRSGILQEVKAHQSLSKAIELNGHGIERLELRRYIAGEKFPL